MGDQSDGAPIPSALAELETATRSWQLAIDLDARIARTRHDIPLLDGEARGSADPRAHTNAQAARDHLARLERDRADLGDAAGRYEQAAAAREAEIGAAGSPVTARLTAIAQERGRHTAWRTEVDQAIAAGAEADQSLTALRRAMDEMWRHATIDNAISLPGVPDMPKYAQVSTVNAMVAGANSRLSDFTRELADVGVAPTFAPAPTVEIGGPVMLLDAMGARMAETAVTLRMSRLINQVHASMLSVRGLVQMLGQRRAAEQSALDALGAERHRLLQAPQ